MTMRKPSLLEKSLLDEPEVAGIAEIYDWKLIGDELYTINSDSLLRSDLTQKVHTGDCYLVKDGATFKISRET